MKEENEDIIKENENGDKISHPMAVMSWIEKTIQIINKYGVVKMLTALLVILFGSFFAYFIINPEHIFELYEEYKDSTHKELIVQRLKNTPLIQDACDELLLRSGADRVLFLELHNNTGNISGMPFYYASASCESIEDGIRPIADQYSEVKLSLVPFATELFKRGYWSGDMEDLKVFDKSLYYKMMSNEAHHVAFKIVEGVEFPCGMLIVTYQKNPVKAKVHDCELEKTEIERTSRKIALYVEAPKIER